jgi:predicted dehydrogenase
VSDAFRIAFVGIDHPHGAGWRESLLNLGDEVQITAIVPRFGGTTYSLEERHAGARRFDTVEELAADGSNLFDGAMICLPNGESPFAAVQLARIGKHILLEKPGAADANAARPIVEAVRQTGVAFQSGYVWRYDAAVDRLRDMVRDGRFGKLICVEMSWVTSDVARRGRDHYLFDQKISGAGFFNWLACHWIDLLMDITGEPIAAVTARSGIFGATATGVEDGGAVIFDLAGGALATFVGGYWVPRWASECRWTIRGSERWVHWDPLAAGGASVITIHGPQPQFQAMDETFSIPPDSIAGYGGSRSVALVRDWIAAARGGENLCRNTPESLLAVLEAVDRIYESSASGRRVDCRIIAQ